MDAQTSTIKEISKLEERLERNRKQRQKLGHELGAGKKCLVCNEKCVGGLNLHYWRKICVNCKCPKESHALTIEDYNNEETFQILGVKVPEHKNLYKYVDKKKPVAKQQVVDIEWTPLVENDTDTNKHEKIDKYFEELDENLIPFKNSDAALKRKELAQIQIPPHDFNPNICDNLTDFETKQLKKYVENVKKNAFGQGKIDLVQYQASPINQPSTISFPSNRHQLMTQDQHNNNNIIPDQTTNLMNQLTLNETQIQCHECKLEITGAYVKAERLGKNAVYHPKCFKCKKCCQLLVDLIYFHYKNEIYCARDLAELMEIPRCSACDELILVSEFTFADNKNYHIKHFVCLHCDLPLAGHQYLIEDKTNNPVCIGCYDQHYANYCNVCKSNIKSFDEGVSFKDFHFHLKCFNCGNQSCKKHLAGSRFCLKENIPYCSSVCVKGTNN